jgi:hypothetical protein
MGMHGVSNIPEIVYCRYRIFLVFSWYFPGIFLVFTLEFTWNENIMRGLNEFNE